MQTGRVIVLNVKGGCGKSTIATNLAGAYAARGLRVALIDYDPQLSSLAWLKVRPTSLPTIHGLSATTTGVPFSNAWQMRVPRDMQRVVVDTPAGLRPADLAGRITQHDRLLIPIQPSAIDMRATADFVRDLLLAGKINPQRHRVGIIANRTNERRVSLNALQRFLTSLHIPVVAYLWDSPLYVTAAETGYSVSEQRSRAASRESEKWSQILQWIDEGLPDVQPKPASAAQPAPTLAPQAAQVQEPIPLFLRLDKPPTRH